MDINIDDIRNNNIKAFKQLFKDYYPILCLFANKYITDPEQCKDIAQDVLLTYWEHRSNFDNIYQVKGFLYTTTRNKSLNQLKHDQYIEENTDIKDYSYIENEIENEIIRQETYLQVRNAVAELPLQMQRIIRLSMIGKKNQEIAEILSISEGTVHSLKKTAYKKLRESLKENFILIFFINLPLQ